MWIEKWRPKTLDEYVFQDDVNELHMRKMVENKDFAHLLLSGPPGTGKTSFAFMLVNLVGIDPTDVLVINASKENDIETVRNRITNFCAIAPFNSDFKVVILEEADYVTKSAQGALRRLMEEHWATVRFILTCNDAHKIKDAIGSRIQHFEFQRLPADTIVGRVVQILEAEGVTVENPDDILRVIESRNGDLRNTIGTLEQYTVNGQLIIPKHLSGTSEHREAVTQAVAEGNWIGLRSYVMGSVADGDVQDLYRIVYDALELSPLVANRALHEQAIVTLAEYLHRSAAVADQYINFAALTIELGRIK